MYRLLLLIILSLFLFLSCDHNPQNNNSINSTDSKVSLDNSKELTEKFVFRKLEDSLNYDYSRADCDLARLTEENISAYEKKDQLKDYDPLLWHYIHYKAKYWFDSGKKIYHYIDPNEFFKQNDRFTLHNKHNYYVLKETKECYSLRIGRYSHPKYAALHALRAYGHQRWRSLSFEQVPHNYGQYCCVWMSDTIKKKENRGYGTRYYLEDEEAEEVLNTNKEYYLDCILFLRDNIVCEVSSFNHIPQRTEYNLYDFAREVDEFIQRQPTVDELKPATLKLTFENFNVDTFKWEPAKDFLQAYIYEDYDNYDYLYSKLNEQILMEFGVINENGEADYKLEKKYENEIEDIHSGIECPLRLTIEITDQLGNKGGKIEVSGIFRGKQNATIPTPLTLKHLESIYDSEIAKGVNEDKISWYENGWSDTSDDGSNIVKLELMPGRYIIVIDVETSSLVESRHFYEINVSGENQSQRVTEILEEKASQEKIKQEEAARLEAENAKRSSSGDWNDDDDDGWD